jgi:4-phosphopantoate--beta-alanine ligase
MTESAEVSPKHPRAESIRIRERLIRRVKSGVVSLAGLIAHGRGEAFDYILGERTTPSAARAIRAAAGALLIAERPVLSVNGNMAALCPRELVELAGVTGAKLEVNLYHRLPGRDSAIEKLLRDEGVEDGSTPSSFSSDLGCSCSLAVVTVISGSAVSLDRVCR